jgi:sugar phosphate isomerase/epimerase
MKRRDFLKNTTAVASLALAGNVAEKLAGNLSSPIGRIGIQLFTIPKLLEKDFEGTLKMLADTGFKELEFYGPFPFSAQEAVERWKTVTPALGFSGSGYFGKTAKETKGILDRYGLSTPSMHTDLVTLKTKLNELAEAAHILGQKYAIIPSAPTRTTLDEYKKDADEFNEIGANAQKLGLRFGYHNHGNGLKELQGSIPLNLIIERTDPKLVFFEMDIYWMTAGGADPVAYFEKYPGRYRLMHIKDMMKQARFSGDGGDPSQWIELFPFMTEPGSGVLDLKKILTAAKKSGMEHFYLEQDMVAKPEEALPKSYGYLSKLSI